MLRSVSSELTLLCKTVFFVCILIAPVAGAVIYLQNREHDQAQRNAPLETIQSYLRATYARDYREAYRFISAADQRVRDETSYVQAQGEFTGFTAQLAGTLADFIDLQVIEQSSDGERAKIKVGYSIPSAEDVSSLVFNWDSEKLNSLSQAEQKQLLSTLVERKRSGSLIAIGGLETFELTREGNGWRIFHDWAAGTKVKVRTIFAATSGIDVQSLQNEIIAKGDEPFQVNLRLKNRGTQRMMLAIRHLVEPPSAADELQMIECGVTRPIALGAGSEQEFSMAYMLSESTRRSVRDLTLTYAFEIKQ
jgi:hypothetical protein